MTRRDHLPSDLEDLKARCLAKYGRLPVLVGTQSVAQGDHALGSLLRVLLGGRVRSGFAERICLHAELSVPEVLDELQAQRGVSVAGSPYVTWEEMALARLAPELFREFLAILPPVASPYPPPPSAPESAPRTLNKGIAPRAKRDITMLGGWPLSPEAR